MIMQGFLPIFVIRVIPDFMAGGIKCWASIFANVIKVMFNLCAVTQFWVLLEAARHDILPDIFPDPDFFYICAGIGLHA